VREDVAEVDDPPPVLNHRNEPVLVAADVEHRENTDWIGVRKIGPDIDQMSPGGSLGYAMPVQQRFQRVLVLSSEFGDGRLANYPHGLQVTKTVTTAQAHKLGPVMPRFQTIVCHARLVCSPYTATETQGTLTMRPGPVIRGYYRSRSTAGGREACKAVMASAYEIETAVLSEIGACTKRTSKEQQAAVQAAVRAAVYGALSGNVKIELVAPPRGMIASQ
jgi:hypothetical protein